MVFLLDWAIAGKDSDLPDEIYRQFTNMYTHEAIYKSTLEKGKYFGFYMLIILYEHIILPFLSSTEKVDIILFYICENVCSVTQIRKI